MASQQGPPSRPWFRLATMVRPPTPQPADQPPPPRPALTIRPAFSQAPPPPQPQPQPPAAIVVPPAPPSLPSSNPRTPPLMQQSVQATSPPPPSRSTPPSLTTATMPPTTNSLSPPKTSSNNKPLSHPPSPLALPSPQLKSYYAPEYDQKSVLVQETKQKQPKGNLDNGDLRRHMTPDTHNPTKKPQASKKHLDSEEDVVGMRIITIAGENKGAIMELTPFGNKTSHKFGKKDNPTTASSTDGDTNSKANHKNQKSPLIMNSNVQAVNNSILYNCSATHHDPGIHFSLSTNPTGVRRSLHKDHMHKLND